MTERVCSHPVDYFDQGPQEEVLIDLPDTSRSLVDFINKLAIDDDKQASVAKFLNRVPVSADTSGILDKNGDLQATSSLFWVGEERFLVRAVKEKDRLEADILPHDQLGKSEALDGSYVTKVTSHRRLFADNGLKTHLLAFSNDSLARLKLRLKRKG